MKKVLILEDEVNIRSFVVINLKRAGYDAIEAGTGREALEKIQEHPDIGVAILDIMLPDIDGFEVCRNIRAMSKQIGIIMLTARAQEMDKVTGLSSKIKTFFILLPLYVSPVFQSIRIRLNASVTLC